MAKPRTPKVGGCLGDMMAAKDGGRFYERMVAQDTSPWVEAGPLCGDDGNAPLLGEPGVLPGAGDGAGCIWLPRCTEVSCEALPTERGALGASRLCSIAREAPTPAPAWPTLSPRHSDRSFLGGLRCVFEALGAEAREAPPLARDVLARPLTGPRVLTASLDGTARLWSATGTQLQVYDHGTEAVLSADFSLDGQRVVTSSSSGSVRLWSADAEQPPLKLRCAARDALRSASLSPSHQQLLLTGATDGARLWDLRSPGKASRVFEDPRVRVSPVSHACFSPDAARSVLTCDEAGVARLWDPRSGGCLRSFQSDAGKALRSCQFSADAKWAVVSSDAGVAELWDLNDGTMLRQYGSEGDWPLWSAALSTGAEPCVVTASRDGAARIFDAVSGKLKLRCLHSRTLMSVCFSGSSGAILTASADGCARLWSTHGGDCYVTFTGHTACVTSARFEPRSEDLEERRRGDAVPKCVSRVDVDKSASRREGTHWL